MSSIQTCRSIQLRKLTGLAIGISIALSLSAVAFAQEKQPGIAAPQQRLYVVGRDTEIPLSAILPPGCEGAAVTFALYARGGAATANTVAYPAATASSVASGTTVAGAIPLASASFPVTDSVWPGVAADCMERPLVSTGPSLLIGQKSADAGTSTFVIPRSSLFMGRDEQQVHAVLKVTAGGTSCAVVDLDDPTAKDAAGNAVFVLGSAGQPAACGQAGALVQLYYPNGDALFETRNVDPGTVQPFANLAPAAGPSSGGPLPPATGDVALAGPSGEDGPGGWVFGASLFAASVVPLLAIAYRRIASKLG